MFISLIGEMPYEPPEEVDRLFAGNKAEHAAKNTSSQVTSSVTGVTVTGAENKTGDGWTQLISQMASSANPTADWTAPLFAMVATAATVQSTDEQRRILQLLTEKVRLLLGIQLYYEGR